MKIYLVGGAVRDALLGLPIKDKDWVVVGTTPQEMLDAGYQQASANPGRVCAGAYRTQIRLGVYRIHLLRRARCDAGG